MQGLVGCDLERAVSPNTLLHAALVCDASLPFKNARTAAPQWAKTRFLADPLYQHSAVHWGSVSNLYNNTPQRLFCSRAISGGDVDSRLKHVYVAC